MSTFKMADVNFIVYRIECCIFKINEKDKQTLELKDIQYNLNGSNTDGSFTVDDSNFFFSPYKIFPIAQENKYLGIFFLILSWNCMLYVVFTH